MSGRLLFKEKQLRLCVVAALTSMAAPIAEGLLLPPKPLASNVSWSCHSGINNDWLCRGDSRQSYKSKSDLQYAKRPVQEPTDSRLSPANPYDDTFNQLSLDTKETEASVSLLESPANHYVLQWMAAKERGQLEALKQRYPVLQNATIAQYQRSGKVWFVLLDGPYPSRIAAMAELDAPPRSHMARELYPWTRSLASIQKLDIIQPEYSSQQLADSFQQELLIQENDIPVNYDISYSTEQNNQLTQYQEAYYNQQPQQALSLANRQENFASDQESYKKQSEYVSRETLPYGSEFNGKTYSDYGSDQNFRVLPEQANPQEMYVSITPAYRSRIPQQHAPRNVDYNIQNIHVTEPLAYGEPLDYRKPPSYKEKEPEPSQPLINVLTANPKSYTIEWMNASRKASLERAMLRYSELQNTQIIHYKKNSRNRYALVSMLFVNRSDALDALLTPSLSRISARFSPKVRQVAYLQSLAGSTPQATHAWAQPRIEPSIHKRQWIGQDDPGEKTYIVSRQPNTTPQRSQERVSHKSRQKMTAYQNTKTAQSPQFEGGYQSDISLQPVKRHQKTINNQQINALLDSPDNSYTIQWFSSSNRQSIERLKKRFPELASAVTVHVKRHQKDWYVLVQGQYRNSQEAIMALKSPTMKNIVMVLHPWTRPLDSLKKQQIASL